ncbi:hypothetical protein HMPREF0569_2242 [Micrococcus luteus SK58]|nr:hypothetical protein HMPREF0569_2242 [Micrococcus luteus SK58]
MDDALVLVRVGQRVQHMADGLETGALLVVRLHDGPRGVGRVRGEEHGLLRVRVVVPRVQGGQVGGRELPATHGVGLPRGEAVELLTLGH